MASAKEIRGKISSIKSTQKITRAMEMVAASKMRKAQDRQEKSQSYAEKIRNVVSHLANAHPEYRHMYLQVRPVKKVGIILVTTDRGLCGPLNSNLLRKTVQHLHQFKQDNIEVELCVIGSKGFNFFKRLGGNIIAHAEHLGDTPKAADLIGIIKIMLDRYESNEIDQIILLHNQFVNTMVQKPKTIQLLPLEANEDSKLKHHWDYIYEPDAKELLTTLLKRYIEMQVYQSVVENIACEQASRMVAMKNATDNAGKIIDDLQLMYNKARQAAITKEIAEIVGGAAAV